MPAIIGVMHTHGLGLVVAGFSLMPNTATIIITETADQIQLKVEYDPWPIRGGPPNYAAIAASKMIRLFHDEQPEDALISQTSYNSDTGETFTKTPPKP